MAENKKIYTISVNGVKESISEIDALVSKLDNLDSRLKNLASRSVNVDVGGTQTASRRDNTGALQTEDKLLKEIYSTEQKIEQVRSQEYQSLMAQKDLLKEAKADAEGMAAAERLAANTYSNTMAGMKAQLKDIKQVMNTTDLGDEMFGEMTQKANELNQKLKEIEVSYGQFGRNVGNYPGTAAEGFSKLTITVNGTAREFDNARQALRELTNERNTLALMGKDVGELDEKVKELRSSINDLNKSSQAMDNLLDTMEGVLAIAQAGKGFSAFFGFDNSAIERSIQKLVALQSILNGIEKVRLQMQTKEGIGKILARSNTYIDSFIVKLTGAKVAEEGLTMSSRAATIAVRGLSLALKGIGIGLITAGIAWLISGIEKLASNSNSAERQIKSLDESLNTLNRDIQRQRELIGSEYLKGYMSDNEFLAKQYELQNKQLGEQIRLLRERAQISKQENESSFLGAYSRTNTEFSGREFTGRTEVNIPSILPWADNIKIAVSSVESLEEAWQKMNDAVNEGKDAFDKYGKGFMGWWGSVITTVNDTKEAMKGLGNVRLSDFISQIENLRKSFENNEITVDEYKAKLRSLVQEMDNSKVLKSVIANLDVYIPDEKVRAAIESIIGELIRLDDAFNMVSQAQVHHWNQVRIDGMKEGWAKTKAQIEENRRYEIEQNGKTEEQIRLINEKYRRQEIEARKSHNNTLLSVDNELARLRINNMRDGIDKQVKLLEQEKKERIQKARETGIRVRELEQEINKEYDKKILDAKREWAYNVQKVYTDMWSRIYALSKKSMDNEFAYEKSKYEEHLREMTELAASQIPTSTVGYRTDTVVRDKYDAGGNKIKSTQEDEAYSNVAKAYLLILDRIEAAQLRIKNTQNEIFDNDGNTIIEGEGGVYRDLSLELETYQANLEAAQQAMDDFLAHIHMTAEQVESLAETQELQASSFTDNLEYQYNKRKDAVKNYYKDIELASKEYIDNVLETEIKQIEANFNDEIRTLKNAYAQEDKEIEDHYRKGELTLEQYNEIVARLNEERTRNEASIFDKYAAQRKEAEQKHFDELRNIRSNSFNGMVNEYRSFFDALTSQETQMFTKSGFLNISATVKRNKELKASYQSLIYDLQQEFVKLKVAFEMKDISFESYEQIKMQLQTILQQTIKSQQQVVQQGKELYETVAGQINQYVQAFGQSLNTIVSSLWEMQSNQYDKQIEELEDFIDEYEVRLNELQDVVQEHNNNVNSIEDELKTARGDRRQALIDQLNAEKQAMKQAWAEQKKIEKEKEKAEEKKRKIQNEQAKKEKQAAVAQAAINAIMAVSMAAVNSWPLPAIPMMALAAAAGAAQLAAVMSKPVPQYADGGVLQGKSHRQGGIKVLGGTAEVEGKEFITNKVTTEKNVDLMYYINSKKKKLSLEDFIDFYGSGSKVSKNVSNVTHKYASGGQLPSVNTNINITDRLLTAFEDYSKRPVVVSVTDIMDRTKDVTEVRVLAGLED